MICVYFSSRLIVFYNSQEAINWNEDTFKYSGCFVYHFKKKLTPKTLQKPPKNLKTQKTQKLKFFKICRVGYRWKAMVQENSFKYYFFKSALLKRKQVK